MRLSRLLRANYEQRHPESPAMMQLTTRPTSLHDTKQVVPNEILGMVASHSAKKVLPTLRLVNKFLRDTTHKRFAIEFFGDKVYPISSGGISVFESVVLNPKFNSFIKSITFETTGPYECGQNHDPMGPLFWAPITDAFRFFAQSGQKITLKVLDHFHCGNPENFNSEPFEDFLYIVWKIAGEERTQLESVIVELVTVDGHNPLLDFDYRGSIAAFLNPPSDEDDPEYDSESGNGTVPSYTQYMETKLIVRGPNSDVTGEMSLSPHNDIFKATRATRSQFVEATPWLRLMEPRAIHVTSSDIDHHYFADSMLTPRLFPHSPIQSVHLHDVRLCGSWGPLLLQLASLGLQHCYLGLLRDHADRVILVPHETFSEHGVVNVRVGLEHWAGWLEHREFWGFN